jgi:hypothetical protein
MSADYQIYACFMCVYRVLVGMEWNGIKSGGRTSCRHRNLHFLATTERRSECIVTRFRLIGD